MKWTVKPTYFFWGTIGVSSLFLFLVYSFSLPYPRPSEFSFILSLLDILGFDTRLDWVASYLKFGLFSVFLFALYDFVESWKDSFFIVLLLLSVPVFVLYATYLSVELLFVCVGFFLVLSQGVFRKDNTLLLFFTGLLVCSLSLPVGILASMVLLLYLLLVWVGAMRRSKDEIQVVFSLSFLTLILTALWNIDALRQLGVRAVTGNIPLLIQSTFFSELTIVDMAQWIGFPLLFLSLLGIYDSLWSSLRKQSLLWLSGLLGVFSFYTLDIISTQFVIALTISPLILFGYTGFKVLERLFTTYIYSMKLVFGSIYVVVFSLGLLSTFLMVTTFQENDVVSQTDRESFETIGELLPANSTVYIPLKYADALSYYGSVDVAVSSQYTQYTFVSNRYEDLVFLENERFVTNLVGILSRYNISHVVLRRDAGLEDIVESSDCFRMVERVGLFLVYDSRCTLQ